MASIKIKSIINDFNFKKGNGLIPAILQDADNKEVLMLGYMNELALRKTLSTGKIYLWSRRRNVLWLKGEKSKNYRLVRKFILDCDGDAILLCVKAATGKTNICCTGSKSCFNRRLI